MEKYSLKWTDFKDNVSSSFKRLRQEKDFFDVTLVSSDEKHISAHKVVLSASSDFFKNILKKAAHVNPMLFLSGVNSKDLSSIMDYIYEGEVQLFQEDLDSFLNTATILKIDGIDGAIDDGSNVKNECFESTEEIEEMEEMKIHKDAQRSVDFHTPSKFVTDDIHPRRAELQKIPKIQSYQSIRNIRRTAETTVNVHASNIDAKAAVNELVMKIDGGWQCKACGKTMKTLDIRRHAEIHIEGLAFSCDVCHETFRSRMKLKHHKSKIHN